MQPCLTWLSPATQQQRWRKHKQDEMRKRNKTTNGSSGTKATPKTLWSYGPQYKNGAAHQIMKWKTKRFQRRKRQTQHHWTNETNHLMSKAHRPPSSSKTKNGRKKLLASWLACHRNAQSRCVSSIDRIIEEPRKRKRKRTKTATKPLIHMEGTLHTHKASSRYMTPKAHQQKASGS